MLKKIFALICALNLITALPTFAMQFQQCTHCNVNESKSYGGTFHTTYLLSPYLLSFPLPFKQAHHNLCNVCENHILNINLSPLQKLGCKHCFMQKNPAYAGCSNARYWSEVLLMSGLACYCAYKAYTWWKYENIEKEEKNSNEQENTKKEKLVTEQI